MFRQSLIRIRKEFNTNPKRFFSVGGGMLAVLILVSTLVDSFLPFTGLVMIVRSLLVVPMSVLFFAMFYALSLYLHNRQRVLTEGAWVPYRLRFSVIWRRRIAIIAAAFVLVFIYATGHSPVYTLMASVYISTFYAMFAWIRPTTDEARLESFNIPDQRDIRYDAQMRRIKTEQEKNKVKRDRFGRRIKEESEDDYDE